MEYDGPDDNRASSAAEPFTVVKSNSGLHSDADELMGMRPWTPPKMCGNDDDALPID